MKKLLKTIILVGIMLVYTNASKAQVGGCTFPTFTFTSCCDVLCNYTICMNLVPLNNPGCPNVSCVNYPCVTYTAGSCNEVKSLVPIDLHCPNPPCPLEGCYKMQLVVDMVTSDGVFIRQAAVIPLYDPTVAAPYRFLNANGTWDGTTDWTGVAQTPQQKFTNCVGELFSYIHLQTTDGFNYTFCDPFLL